MTSFENRAQSLYWSEVVQLKVDCCYMRLYRDRLSRTMTRFAVVRAVVSSTALGAWAVTRAYSMVWGGIIASAQIADAMQKAIPFAARYQGRATFSYRSKRF